MVDVKDFSAQIRRKLPEKFLELSDVGVPTTHRELHCYRVQDGTQRAHGLVRRRRAANMAPSVRRRFADVAPSVRCRFADIAPSVRCRFADIAPSTTTAITHHHHSETVARVQFGFLLVAAICRNQMGTVLRGRPAQYAQCRQLRLSKRLRRASPGCLMRERHRGRPAQYAQCRQLRLSKRLGRASPGCLMRERHRGRPAQYAQCRQLRLSKRFRGASFG